MNSVPLTLDEIMDVFRRHPNTQRDLAVELNVRPGAISSCLRGRFASKRIEQACKKRALELIEEEKLQAA